MRSAAELPGDQPVAVVMLPSVPSLDLYTEILYLMKIILHYLGHVFSSKIDVDLAIALIDSWFSVDGLHSIDYM